MGFFNRPKKAMDYAPKALRGQLQGVMLELRIRNNMIKQMVATGVKPSKTDIEAEKNLLRESRAILEQLLANPEVQKGKDFEEFKANVLDIIKYEESIIQEIENDIHLLKDSEQ